MPPLHGRILGGEDVNGIGWQGVFDFLPSDSTWAFYYLDEMDDPVLELAGYGSTPLEAFEGLISKWIFLNDHQESPTLKELLPLLRNVFTSDGGVKLEYLIAEM